MAGNRHLSDYADRYYHGPLRRAAPDAFVFHNMEVGDEIPCSRGVKIGQPVTSSGGNPAEPSARPPAMASPAWISLEASGIPRGPEAERAVCAPGPISASFTPEPRWTFAARYFLDWNAAHRLPGSRHLLQQLPIWWASGAPVPSC